MSPGLPVWRPRSAGPSRRRRSSWSNRRAACSKWRWTDAGCFRKKRWSGMPIRGKWSGCCGRPAPVR